MKILADEQTGQIAGAQLMCERASDLVSLFGEALHLMHGKEKMKTDANIRLTMTKREKIQ